MPNRIYNSSNNLNKFYVYLWYYEDKVFYVGKGCDGRSHSFYGRTKNYKLRILFKEIERKNEILKDVITIKIIRNNLREFIAHQIERVIIKMIGLENLCNLTEGGEGVSQLRNTKLVWTMISPSGNEYSIKNMNQFCKEHNLNQGNMSRVAQGKLKSCGGWKCKNENTPQKIDKIREMKIKMRLEYNTICDLYNKE